MGRWQCDNFSDGRAERACGSRKRIDYGFLTVLRPGTQPQKVQDDRYSYDPAGNPAAISDWRTGDPDAPIQHQCFSYDGASRLKSAFTTTAEDCSGGTDSADGKGQDPYKLGYDYTGDGNIRAVTDNDVTRDYTYPDPPTIRPSRTPYAKSAAAAARSPSATTRWAS